MKIVVRAKADRDLDNIFEWIAKDNAAAATAMIRVFGRELIGLSKPVFRKWGGPALSPVRESWC
jgi:plasmid stabilization system protein ParE